MAKKKSKSHSGRDASAIARGAQLLDVMAVPRLSDLTPILPQIEDRRAYNPTRSTARPGSVSRDAARLTLRQSRVKSAQTKAPLSFANPDKVALCARRSIRREVLHAKRIAGRSGLKRPRRNYWSSISCRR